MSGSGRNVKFILIVRPALWSAGSPYALLLHCTLFAGHFPQKYFEFLIWSWSVLSRGPEKNLKSSKKIASHKVKATRVTEKKFISNNRD